MTLSAESFSREDRELSFVPRWCIVRTIRQQNVDSHSFYVALWADRIARAFGITDIQQLYILGRIALTHDMQEIYSGDIPSTFKRVLKEEMGRDLHGIDNFGGNPASEREIAALDLESEPYRLIIKAADLIEALVFICEEIQFGNSAIRAVMDDIQQRLAETIEELNEIFKTEVQPLDFIFDLKTIHCGRYTTNMRPIS